MSGWINTTDQPPVEGDVVKGMDAPNETTYYRFDGVYWQNLKTKKYSAIGPKLWKPVEELAYECHC